MTPAEIKKQIQKRRVQLLIHRYLYYVKAEPIITDYQYDMLERDLKALVEKHPDLAFEKEEGLSCPTRNVGSSNVDDYPRAIQQLAESLLITHKHLQAVEKNILTTTCGQ